MLLVSSKRVFIEKETAWLLLTMQKCSSAMASLMRYIKSLHRYHSVRHVFVLATFNVNHIKTELSEP